MSGKFNVKAFQAALKKAEQMRSVLKKRATLSSEERQVAGALYRAVGGLPLVKEEKNILRMLGLEALI